MKLRVGVPLTSGRMVQHVADRGYPCLFSANAFFSKDRDGRAKLRNVSLPPGLDAALDSAGFVAMAHYGGYIWSDEDYLDLVQAYPWAWWSAMDMCVESEIAGDRRAVRMRLAGTVNGYHRLARLAALRGLSDPVPVLQGRSVSDYLWCADQLPIEGRMVGLGSFCRRNVWGPDGIVAIVEALDKHLPRDVTFHCYGVKGGSLEIIGEHPRLASVDSMAWDTQARYGAKFESRSMDYRLRVMDSWLEKNMRRKAFRPDTQASDAGVLLLDEDDEISEWMELVANGEIDYASAMAHMDHLWIGAPSHTPVHRPLIAA